MFNLPVDQEFGFVKPSYNRYVLIIDLFSFYVITVCRDKNGVVINLHASLYLIGESQIIQHITMYSNVQSVGQDHSELPVFIVVFIF